MMRQPIRILAFLFVFGLLPSISQAQTYPDYVSTTVNDFASVLDTETEIQIDEMLRAAKEERDLEMTVVTITSLRDYKHFGSIETYAKNLFNKWGIGNATRNDGILMLVSIQDRKMRIALGSGYPAVYDGAALRVIDRTMLPRFRTGQYRTGIREGVEHALATIRLPDRSQPLTSPARWGEEARLVSERAKNNPILAAIIGALGLGGAAVGGQAVNRRRPRRCPKCRRLMRRLGDVQEDQYLDYGQLVEERLGSKDYGVWICTYDEHVTTIAYSKWFSGYSACPNCRYKTYETDRTVERGATTTSEGSARLDHHCKNCDHRATEYAVIPMIRESDNDSFSGGGSGGGGGSFGGGSSSGGGASGSW
jgi:uncharacterized protein